MARIHNLSSKLTLNTRDFTTGFDRARKKARAFGAGIGRVGKRTAMMGAAASTAAVAGVAVLYKHHSAAIDQNVKFADSIGVSTEALMGFRHAANITGTEQGTLDKGMQRLVRQMGELQNGEAAAVKGFGALGLSAQDLAGKLPEEAIGLVADRLNQQPDAAGKAAAAYALFGRQGQEMVNFLALGSEGLAAQRAEAEQLGLTFSRVDAAKVEAANDAITRVKAGIQGAGQSLTVALAPYVQATAEEFLNLGLSGASMSDKIVGGVEFVAMGVAKTADVFGFFKAAFHGAQAAVTYGLGLLVKGWAMQGRAIESVVNLLPGVEVRFSDTLTMMGDELTRTAKIAAEKSQASFDAALAGENSEAVAARFQNIRDRAEASAQAIAADAAAKQNNTNVTADLITQLDAEANAQVKVVETLEGIGKQLDRFGLNDTDIKIADLDALGATNEQLDQARKTLVAIKRLEDDRDRRDEITSVLSGLEGELETFGLTDQERTLFDLEKLGASADEIERARAAMDQLTALESQKDRVNRLGQSRDAGRSVQLRRAGSAESQRLAFQAARGLQRDDTPKQQLDVQKQMAGTLARIETNQQTAGGGEWTL